MGNDIYKTACDVISRNMRDWALDVMGGSEFANFVQGVLALADELVGRGTKTDNEDGSSDC